MSGSGNEEASGEGQVGNTVLRVESTVDGKDMLAPGQAPVPPGGASAGGVVEDESSVDADVDVDASSESATSPPDEEDSGPGEQEVVCIKLLSGLDIIGITVTYDEEDGAIEISRPHAMNLVATPRGPALSMRPLFLFAANKEHNITVYRVQYLIAYKPDMPVQDEYLQTVSGIVIARGNVGRRPPQESAGSKIEVPN